MLRQVCHHVRVRGRPGAGSVQFREKIENRSAVVGIFGLGYVGIPLALTVAESGLPVLGFDIDPGRVAELNAGRSPIKHIPPARIAALREAGFEATGDVSRARDCDALVICVPTPLDQFREPDMSFVTATMEQIAPALRPGQLLSLESTTWPGTSRELLLPYLEAAGLEVGRDAHLVYSPEREDPGNASFKTQTIPKVVGGHTPACLAAGEALYGAFIDHVVPVSSCEAAEMAKLLENIHRAINIGLVNEVGWHRVSAALAPTAVKPARILQTPLSCNL